MIIGIAQKVANTLFAVPHHRHHHKFEVLNAPTNDATLHVYRGIYLVLQLNVVSDCVRAVFVRTIFGT